MFTVWLAADNIDLSQLFNLTNWKINIIGLFLLLFCFYHEAFLMILAWVVSFRFCEFCKWRRMRSTHWCQLITWEFYVFKAYFDLYFRSHSVDCFCLGHSCPCLSRRVRIIFYVLNCYAMYSFCLSPDCIMSVGNKQVCCEHC